MNVVSQEGDIKNPHKQSLNALINCPINISHTD